MMVNQKAKNHEKNKSHQYLPGKRLQLQSYVQFIDPHRGEVMEHLSVW